MDDTEAAFDKWYREWVNSGDSLTKELKLLARIERLEGLLRKVVNSGDKDSCWISASGWYAIYRDCQKALGEK